MFRDRNFAAGMLFIAIVGLTYYASMALQPPYLQELMNYPVVTAGLVMGPRGIGTMVSMLFVGRMVGRVDTRILLVVGLSLTAWSFYQMTGWTPDISQGTIIGVTMVQGFGLGFLFVPLSAATLSTLPMDGGPKAPGCSACRATWAPASAFRWSTACWCRIFRSITPTSRRGVTPVNRAFENPLIAHAWNPLTAGGRAALDAVITQQAQIIAYIDDYKFLMIATLVVMPLLFVFKALPRGGTAAPVIVHE